MKINFLTNGISDLTGGAIYDKELYEELKKKFGESLFLIQDSDFDLINKKNIDFYDFGTAYIENIERIFNCDILIVNSRLYPRFIKTLLSGKMKNINCKVYMTHHHYNYMTRNGLFRIVHGIFELLFLSKADKLIIPNPYVIKLTKDRHYIKGKIIILNPNLYKGEYSFKVKKNKRILYVGTVEKRKGLKYGIKSFSLFSIKHPDYVFNIVGAYDRNYKYYKSLIKLCKRLKISDKVLFCGRVSEQDKEWYYEHSDIFLFPSLNEGYGWVIVEAMSHGLPVIAFDNTAMPYTIFNDKNGKLARNKNIRELSKFLETILMSDDETYRRLSLGAIDTYKNVASHKQVDQDIQMLVNEILKEVEA